MKNIDVYISLPFDIEEGDSLIHVEMATMPVAGQKVIFYIRGIECKGVISDVWHDGNGDCEITVGFLNPTVWEQLKPLLGKSEYL